MANTDPPLPRRLQRAPAERVPQVANLMDQLKQTPAKISLWTYIEDSPKAREDLERALKAVKEAHKQAEAAGVDTMRVGLHAGEEIAKAAVEVSAATSGVALTANIIPRLPMYTVTKAVVKLGPHAIEAIIDTGASGTTMSHVVARRLELYKYMVEAPCALLTASGERYKPLGLLRKVPITIGRLTLPVHVTVTATSDYDMLIGHDWLMPAGAILDLEAKRMTYRLAPEVQESVHYRLAAWPCSCRRSTCALSPMLLPRRPKSIKFWRMMTPPERTTLTTPTSLRWMTVRWSPSQAARIPTWCT